ncbi:hypothetical protein DSO57_1000039 [Entomophthora muscae]|uniref:Uncharacterized protein n=1 Tax=Entomophthora muscae TaxID=34485 RepID=A0ACC2SMF4_9FUNG|nr:hypothetical protein DSO57_1000039 [Entomophthora muscae]
MAPVKVNSLLIYRGQITRVWNTSLEVAVRVEVQNREEPTPKFCCSALLTFVLIKGPLDDLGRLRLPQIYPEGARQTVFYEAADRRRIARIKESKSTNNELAFFRDFLLLDPRAKENPSYCETIEFVLPTHTNNIQSTFGGQMMKWMESCAGISAGRQAIFSEVTSASCDALQFVKPSRVTDILTFRSVVTRSFNTSAEVYIVVTRHAASAEREEFTNEGFFTFVCPKSSSNPNKDQKSRFKELHLATEPEKMMHASAILRRERRITELKALVPPKL